MKLHQKKFYSSEEVDQLVEEHRSEKGLKGYSEALRDIVIIQKVGIVKDGQVKFNSIDIEEELARR